MICYRFNIIIYIPGSSNFLYSLSLWVNKKHDQRCLSLGTRSVPRRFINKLINKGNIRLFWICKGRECTQWSDVRKLLVLGVFCDTCIPITFFHLNSRTKLNRSLKFFQCKKIGDVILRKGLVHISISCLMINCSSSLTGGGIIKEIGTKFWK